MLDNGHYYDLYFQSFAQDLYRCIPIQEWGVVFRHGRLRISYASRATDRKYVALNADCLLVEWIAVGRDGQPEATGAMRWCSRDRQNSNFGHLRKL
jgi:hypothetical protein